MLSHQTPKPDLISPSPKLCSNGRLLLLHFDLITSCLSPLTRYSKSTTDKPWVTPEFRETIKCRQKAFSQGNIAKYHLLRNRTQHMAAKLRKTYFSSKVEQLYSSDLREWWLKTRRILKMDHPNPLANLDYQSPPALLAETINSF